MHNEERYKRLTAALEEVMFDEANPAHWSGGMSKVKDLSKGERGDRYWDKKNAAMTVALLAKIEALVESRKKASGNASVKAQEDAEAEDLSKQIAKAEKEAMRIIERVQKAH